ncbi:MAG: glycosyltransferase [Victivallaceae bacterium]|nr:glycosyltransferase [Victivallaceae bacterium]
MGGGEKSICFVATTAKHLALFMLPQANYFAAHGWRVAVATTYDPALAAKLAPGIEYHTVPMKRGAALFSIPLHIMRLRRIFKRGNFTFVQYFMPNAALYASVAAKLAGVPFRYYQLGGLRYSSSTGLKRRLLIMLDRISGGCSTHIWCVSRGNLETAAADGVFPASKAMTIGGGGSKGVNLELFDPAMKDRWRREKRAELGFSDDDFVIGFAGSLRRDKGTAELIDAFRAVHEARPNTKLLLVGDREFFSTVPPDRRRFALESPDVRIIPAADGAARGLDFEDVPKYEACFDVLGFPSYREGLPNVVLECQALNIPVVAADVPGMADAFLPGENGIAVPVRDAAALAAALVELCDSPAKCAEMGKKGREFVEKNFNQAILMGKLLAEKEARL